MIPTSLWNLLILVVIVVTVVVFAVDAGPKSGKGSSAGNGREHAKALGVEHAQDPGRAPQD